MIDFKLSLRRSAYSDNGDGATPDRDPNRAHPQRSHGTWVAVAIGGSAVVGAGASMYSANKAAGAAGSAPPPRNLGTELGSIGNSLGGFANQAGDAYAANAGRFGQTNLNSFTNTLRGNFDPQAFESANPGFLAEFQQMQAGGQLAGWTPEQYALARVGNNQSALNGSYGNNLPTQLRQGYDAANPQQTAYNSQLKGTMDRLNGQPAPSYNATGYNASGYQASGSGNQMERATALAGYNPQAAQAYLANQQSAQQQNASGGPLLGAIEGDARSNLGQVSPLQLQQQRIAQSLLGAGSGLTAAETMGAQDSARAAYADRGLLRSNRGIGAEILLTDAAQRQRLTQNLGIAQGIDTAGQQQLTQGRNYALGVQGQGQNLSTFNAGQGNSLNTFNAGQGNSLNTFNAQNLTQNSQFNAGQANNIGLNLANSNADRVNQNNQYQQSLLQNNNQFNAAAMNEAGRYNSGATNAANAYNSGASNDANRFNATMLGQNQNDQFSRAMGYGSYLGGQSINAPEYAMRLSQNAPDYTNAVLGYGNDVNNTNYNGAASAANSARNNSAALMGAGISATGALGSAAINAYRPTAGTPNNASVNSPLNPATGLPW